MPAVILLYILLSVLLLIPADQTLPPTLFARPMAALASQLLVE